VHALVLTSLQVTVDDLSNEILRVVFYAAHYASMSIGESIEGP
jgi:hypothetical protein